MNTMRMPGFTAEVSLYQNTDFGNAKSIMFQNTTENVAPAMSDLCENVGVTMANAVEAGDGVMANFLLHFMVASGCFRGPA